MYSTGEVDDLTSSCQTQLEYLSLFWVLAVVPSEFNVTQNMRFSKDGCILVCFGLHGYRYEHACAYVVWLGYLWCNVSGQRRVYLLPEGRTLSVRENCALKNVSAHHVVLSFLVLASSPSFFFYLSFSFSTFVYGVGCACVVAQTQSGR